MVFSLRFMIIVCLVILPAITANSYDEDGWKAAAAFLKEGYNSSGDPCHNFMDYACGQWFKTVGKEQQSTLFYQYTLMYNKLEEAIQSIDLEDEKTPKFKRAVRVFFDKCVENIEENSTQIVVELFHSLIKILKTPPILAKEAIEKEGVRKENIWQVLGQAQRDLPLAEIFFAPTTLTFESECTGKSAVLRLSPITEGLNRLEAFEVFFHFKFLAKALNIKVDDKDLRHRLQKMVEFDEAVAQFYNNTESTTQAKANVAASGAAKTSGKSNANGKSKANTEGESTESQGQGEITFEDLPSLDDLEKEHGNISWSNYFQGLFSKEQFEAWNQSANVLYIDDLDFMDSLSNVLSKFDAETVHDYIFYRAMRTYYELLKPKNKTGGPSPRQCVEQVSKMFKSASARILFDHFKWDMVEFKHDLELMYETVVSALKFLVTGSDWLDYEDKMAVIKKANGFQFYSGIPDWFNNDDEVDVRTIQLDEKQSQVHNLLAILKKNFDRDLDYVVGIRDLNADDEPEIIVNAFYLKSHIELKLGYFMPPWYHPRYPLPVKYGIIGFVIGHEIMHGFDAARINEVPTYVSPWLKPETLKTFGQKRDCLIKQYSSYCFKERKQCLSGKNSVTENMADIDGLKLAYMAYKFAVQTIGDEPPLPGFLDLTGDELFFLTAGRSRCTTGAELSLILGVENEPHAPDQTRVDVPFRNFPIFAKTFKCATGSNYAPLKTCSVWGSFNAGNKLNRW